MGEVTMNWRYWTNILCCLYTSLTLARGEEDYETPRHYVLNLTQTTFEDAQVICSENGGSLATIYDYSTIPDLQLGDFLKSTEEALVWIGLIEGDDGTQIWDNGESVTYTNWEQGTGNSNTGCIAASFREPYRWTSQACASRLPFLCQYIGGECRFDVYHNASIAAHNYMYVYEKSAEECQEVCRKSNVFLCQSFEYDPKGRRCQFNSGNRWILYRYFSSHEDWDYYHRTCNSGEVTGALLDLSPPSTTYPVSSIESSSSSTSPSSSISPTPTFLPETSSPEVLCSETSITRDVYITHDVYQTHLVTVTSDVHVTREILVTRDIFVTNDVTLSSTLTETSYVTITETTEVTVTPSPVLIFPSVSKRDQEEVVEELKKEETAIKEKAKALKKVSAIDDRPSATYVGFFAILFLSCVFGAIVLFDMLTIFKSGLCQKCTKKCKGKRSKLAPSKQQQGCSRQESDAGIVAIASFGCGNNSAEIDIDKDSPNQSSDKRLWRKSLWAFGDSGFGGSNSETTNSETGSCTFIANVGGKTGVVTVEVQDSRHTDDNSSPASSGFTSSILTSEGSPIVSNDRVNGVERKNGAVDVEYDERRPGAFSRKGQSDEVEETHF